MSFGGHIDGFSKALEDANDFSVWETKDARIVSWILGSMDVDMVNNLHSFTSAKEIWEYLKWIYYQDNNAKRFQFELEIAKYS